MKGSLADSNEDDRPPQAGVDSLFLLVWRCQWEMMTSETEEKAEGPGREDRH